MKPDYKDQSVQSKIVISAGIADIRMPGMASAEHILVLWIPAIPRHSLTGAGSAGKTLLLKHLYNQEMNPGFTFGYLVKLSIQCV